MPRANRYYIPQQTWHITQRCHNKAPLLKYKSDRGVWIHWLREAINRYEMKVLDYCVMTNHIHLLVSETKPECIRSSMQFLSGITAQYYNKKYGRRGAFWEDRYHATAIAGETHLLRCIIYIDLNPVRAGIVSHPGEWSTSGFTELTQPKGRRLLIAHKQLYRITGCTSGSRFRALHRNMIRETLDEGKLVRNPALSEAIAYGSKDFIRAISAHLTHRYSGQVLREVESERGWLLTVANSRLAHLKGI